MANQGYTPEYATVKVAHIDGLISANKDEAKRLNEQRKQYAPFLPKTSKSDD